MTLDVKPIRWGVVLDGVPIGEVWDAGGELHACAFVRGLRAAVPLSYGETRYPQNAANAVRDFLAKAQVFEPRLSRAATLADLQPAGDGKSG